MKIPLKLNKKRLQSSEHVIKYISSSLSINTVGSDGGLNPKMDIELTIFQ